MHIAIYGRVSTSHQVEHQTIEQQLGRLTAHVGTQAAEGWALDPAHVFRDDGVSGAVLARPGLDRLRDTIKDREVDRVLVTAPDRLARNYVHQMVLLEDWTRAGCAAEFLDRPMSDDPHDHLLLQIRGAVAKYERTLIAERMRRGRLAKLRAGTILLSTAFESWFSRTSRAVVSFTKIHRVDFARVCVPLRPSCRGLPTTLASLDLSKHFQMFT